MDTKSVAIIILNYNGWSDTIECLESIFKSDYLNYQIIVVDNNSFDNSFEHLKSWAEGKISLWIEKKNKLRGLSFPLIDKPIPYLSYNREEAERGGCNGKETENKFFHCSFKPLILIQSGENLGFAGGNNIGIRYVLQKQNFEYLWLLNNDTIIEKHTLSRMIDVMESDDAIGITGSKLFRYYNPEQLQVLCGTEKMTWKNGGNGKYIHPINKNCEELNKTFEINGYIVGASILARKETIKNIGLFDEAYFMWAEESDLCIRAIKHGWKLYCCGEAKVWHKEGASTGQEITRKLLWKKSRRPTLKRFLINGYLDIRNHIYFVKKHYGKFYIWPYIFLNFPKFTKKAIAIIIYDDRKILRLKLLYKGFVDGITGNMGKPKWIEEWKN